MSARPCRAVTPRYAQGAREHFLCQEGGRNLRRVGDKVEDFISLQYENDHRRLRARQGLSTGEIVCNYSER